LRQQIICGIDIGNHAVKTIIAGIGPGSLRPQVLGVGSALSTGLRRGMVFDMDETTANIGESIKQAENMASVKVDRAYASINGLHIRTQPSRGVIVVSRADNEITRHDVDRLIEAASTVSLPPNREIIHVIPKVFVIDAQEHVKNPIGMKGVRLEAEVTLVEGLSPYIRNLAKCINANDVEVVEFIYVPLALAKSVLERHQKEHGVLSLDFGGGISTMAFFHEGEPIYMATLPIGSRHVTNDLAVAFRTSMDKAEKIKLEYGLIGSEDLKREQVDLSTLVNEENFTVPKKQIAKIVNCRASELFDLIATELKKLPHSYLLPAGVVLTGGGANLPGLVDFVKNRLNLAVVVGEDRMLEGLSDKISDPAFAVATGLVAWGFEKQFGSGKIMPAGRLISDTAAGISRWFKNFLP